MYLAASERGNFPLPQLRDLPVWSSGGLTGGQRRGLLRDVNGACNALKWMHGEDSRSAARPPPLVATETRINVFVLTCSSMRWVDADSAVDEHEALGKLLKGRTGYAPCVSSNVGSYECSRVSLPDSVADAPPLIEMLPAEARFFLEEFQSRMLLPPEVATESQEVTGEPGCHNNPWLLHKARSYARFEKSCSLTCCCRCGNWHQRKRESGAGSPKWVAFFRRALKWN